VTTDEQRRKEEEHRGTAYHEAGHAVVNRHLGYAVSSVTIEAGDDYQGAVLHDDPLFGCDLEIDDVESGTDEKIAHSIIVAFAGPAAEKHLNPEFFNLEGARGDYKVIADLVFCLVGHPDQATAKADELDQQAQALVLEHWPHIDRVARALLDRTELTGDDLETLISLGEPAG